MSMTPDYGEPWKEKAYNYTVGDTGDVEGVIEIRTREELRVTYAWNPSDENEALFSRAVACVNACAGMADPAAEIEAMREAIQEGHDALDTCIEFIQDAHIIEAQWDWEPVKKANATLAKLQPFLPDATPPKP
jgi:hypothetical protein